MRTNRRDLAAVASPSNLHAAWCHVKARRAAGGLDRVTVDEFAQRAERELERLAVEMLEERYAPEPVRQLAVPKDSAPGERRVLGLACVRDKVAQQAVRQVLEPRCERLFLDCSYGYRPNKGPQRAVARVTHHLQYLRHTWVVSADIDNFFPSLKHDLVLDQVRALGMDEAIVRLLALWLKMGTVDGHARWHDVESGVVQGGVVSPVLANLYLQPFDQSMADRHLGLVRYADDFVITTKDRAEAERGLEVATAFLGDRLGLRLNPNPRAVVAVEDGFDFLGIGFSAGERRISEIKLDSARSRLARVTSRAASISDALRAVNDAAGGWRRYYGAIVSPSELGRLEAIVRQVLVDLIRCARNAGALKTVGLAAEALAHAECLVTRPSSERQKWIQDIVHTAFAHADHAHADTPATTAPTHDSQVPRRNSRGAGQSARRRGSSRHKPGIEATVRARKRRHVAQASVASELILNTCGCFLGKSGERLVVRRERRTVCETPIDRITGITVATHGISLSADAVHLCSAHRVPILFTDGRGRSLAMVIGQTSSSGDAGLRQLEAIRDGRPAFDLARRLVHGKIVNQLSLLKSIHKYRKTIDADFCRLVARCADVVATELQALSQLQSTGPLQTERNRLMSVEGRAAAAYWEAFGQLVRARVPFEGREHHGARDLANSLLNYGYAVLQARVHLAVLKAGLEPHIGVLHALHREDPALVFDLMEEFRAQVVDRVVLALVDRREPLKADDGGLLTAETRRRLLQRLHARLATIVRFRGTELTVQEVIDHQARAVVRHLRGESQYRPYLARW